MMRYIRGHLEEISQHDSDEEDMEDEEESK